MKRNTLLLIAISLFFLACEEERLPGEGESTVTEGDAVPVKFNVELDLGSETEYVPMTRAEQPKNLTRVTGGQQDYLLLKLVNDGWYIDKKGTWKIEGLTYDYGYFVTATTSWSPIEMELRPGTYRLAVFLNSRSLARDETLKEGSRVADKDTDVRDFQCFLTYETQQQYVKPSYLLTNEVFTGYVEFRVNKNDNLHTDTPERSFHVLLTRKVGQFQFLMKKTPGKDGSVIKTPYNMSAVLKAKPDDPFVKGINVLGLPYLDKQSPLISIEYVTYTQGRPEGWRTDKAGREYQMMETGSSVPAFFLIADPEDKEGVPFEIEVARISGQSGNDWYQYTTPVSKVLKANQVCGVAFESSGNRLYPDPQSQDEYCAVIAQLATDDAGRTLEESEFLFPPYYIWNESMFVGPKKE